MFERQRYELLCEELKKARVQANLLQIDLAVRLNKPQSYISKVESGERNLDVVEYASYCNALGVDASKHFKKLML
jgi:transcriptional regulator with XRE-family HTH domain